MKKKQRTSNRKALSAATLDAMHDSGVDPACRQPSAGVIQAFVVVENPAKFIE